MRFQVFLFYDVERSDSYVCGPNNASTAAAAGLRGAVSSGTQPLELRTRRRSTSRTGRIGRQQRKSAHILPLAQQPRTCRHVNPIQLSEGRLALLAQLNSQITAAAGQLRCKEPEALLRQSCLRVIGLSRSHHLNHSMNSNRWAISSSGQ